MEDENQVFDKNAEAVVDNENLKSEDLIFYHQNKEEAKNNIDNSSKELTDFVDSLIKDVPGLSEEEINSGVKKILEKAYPAETNVKPMKKKKVKLKVLFIAALLSVLSFSCLYVVGSSHNISIENGFVTFAKDTMRIVFFGESEEEFISVDTLLIDLETHGYEDILFPEEFLINANEYKVKVPVYIDDNVLGEQVTFDINSEKNSYGFIINKDNSNNLCNYPGVVNALTLNADDNFVNIYEFKSGASAAEYFSEEYHCYINAQIPYSEMVKLVETLK